MKRLSLSLALICLLLGGIGAVERSNPKEDTWRLLSSISHYAWWSDEIGNGETWESSTYYYNALEPLKLDSLRTTWNSYHYFFYDYPDYSEKETLVFNLPGYIPYKRTVETFSSEGLLLSFKEYDSHAPDENINELIEYSYDNSGNLIRELISFWATQVLDYLHLTLYTYRSDNQLSQKNKYRVIDNNLQNLELVNTESRTYNAAGLLEGRYYWYLGNASSRILYTYNDDMLLSIISGSTCPDSLVWIPDSETHITYIESFGEMKWHQVSTYNYYDSVMVLTEVATHSYSNNNLNESVSIQYDGGSNSFTNEVYVYNSGRQLVSLISDFYTDGSHSNYELTNVWDLASDLEDPYLPKPDLKLSAYPNPFNPRTTIHYKLKSSGKVVLDLYNIRGQRLKRLVNAIQEPGEQTVELLLNSSELGSGVYFLRLEAGGNTESTKILLLK